MNLIGGTYLTEGDIPFVRIENIRGGFDINMDNIIYISSQDNNRIKNSQLHVDDIVLSKVGNSIGFFARVDESVGVCNISENNIGIKLAKYSTIEKHYILTYLNCKHAQMLVLRRTSGNAQPKLNVGDLCHIPIPQFTNRFYESISKTILQSKSYGKRVVTKIHDLEKQAISAVWSVFSLNAKDESFKTKEEMDLDRDSYEVVRQRPLNYFLYHRDVSWRPNREKMTASEEAWYRDLFETLKTNSVLWFLDFVYRLRNALFHEIIDPLDEEWQIIFKNAYLVLKEVVDINISEIETKS